MRSRWMHAPTLHTEHHDPKKVSWLELFFDLILVAAAIQLGDALSGELKRTHQVLVPALKFAGYFSTLFWAWASFTFYSNRFDIDDFTHRGLAFLNMMAIGAMAIAVPPAMRGGDTRIYSLAFALTFAVTTWMYLRAWKHETAAKEYSRFGVMTYGAATVLVLLSAVVPAPWRFAMWVIALLVLVVAFNVPKSLDLYRRFPVDMEHLSERFGLLIIIVLGESFVKVLSQLSGAELATEPGFIATGLLTLLITFCVWWIYFDDVAGAEIRERKFSSMIWFVAHMPLAIGITALGVGLKKLVGVDLAGVAAPEYRWLLGGAIALTFMAVALIDSVTKRRNVLLSDSLRIQVRMVSAFVVMLATAVGDSLSAGGFVTVITGLCLTQVIFDVMMAPFEEGEGDKLVATGAEAGQLMRQRQQDGEEFRGSPFDQAIRTNVPEGMRQDLYLFLMKGSWTQLVVGTVLIFAVTNLVFGGLYLLDPGSIDGAEHIGLAEAFAFSVQTISTIGFGTLSPATPLGNFLVTVEALVGILGLAFLTGLIFAKASRPQPGVLFSKRMVISRRDGVPTVMIRVANVHNSEIIDARLQLSMAMEEVSAEGHHLTRSFPLTLTTDRVPLFALSFTMMHAIDQTSPLYGLSQAEIRERVRVIILSLSGHDTVYGQNVSARAILFSDAIYMDHHYLDVIGATEDGRVIIDFAMFDEIAPDEEGVGEVGHHDAEAG